MKIYLLLALVLMVHLVICDSDAPVVAPPSNVTLPVAATPSDANVPDEEPQETVEAAPLTNAPTEQAMTPELFFQKLGAQLSNEDGSPGTMAQYEETLKRTQNERAYLQTIRDDLVIQRIVLESGAPQTKEDDDDDRSDTDEREETDDDKSDNNANQPKALLSDAEKKDRVAAITKQLVELDAHSRVLDQEEFYLETMLKIEAEIENFTNFMNTDTMKAKLNPQGASSSEKSTKYQEMLIAFIHAALIRTRIESAMSPIPPSLLLPLPSVIDRREKRLATPAPTEDEA